jgi:hypothetical protein
MCEAMSKSGVYFLERVVFVFDVARADLRIRFFGEDFFNERDISSEYRTAQYSDAVRRHSAR